MRFRGRASLVPRAVSRMRQGHKGPRLHPAIEKDGLSKEINRMSRKVGLNFHGPSGLKIEMLDVGVYCLIAISLKGAVKFWHYRTMVPRFKPVHHQAVSERLEVHSMRKENDFLELKIGQLDRVFARNVQKCVRHRSCVVAAPAHQREF